MDHRAVVSLTIAALCVHGFSEGYPFASRHKRSGEAGSTPEGSAIRENEAGSGDDPHRDHSSFADGAARIDEAPPEARDGLKDGIPSADAPPSDDGLIASLGNKKPGEGGGGLFPSLPSFPSPGGGGAGGGGGVVGPMAVLGGFTALVMPMGGPLLNNLPGALSSLMGLMPNSGSLPTLPGLGGSSG